MWSTPSGPCTRAGSVSSSPSAETPVGHAGHGVHGGGPSTVQPDGPGFDEAQPLAPGDGPCRAHPAMPRALGARPPGKKGRSSSRWRTAWGSSARPEAARPGVPVAAQRARHRRGTCRGRPRPRRPLDWSALAGDYDVIALTLSASSRASPTSTGASGPDPSTAQSPRDERRFETAGGRARFTLHELPEDGLCRASS